MMTGTAMALTFLMLVWAAVDLNKSDAQLQWERWVKMCKTSDAYHAMRQAYALHRPNPCERK
jgi:hypothetical protein